MSIHLIMTTYNRPDMIGRVLRAMTPAVHAHVYDDGSALDNWAKLEAFSRWPRVHLFRMPHHGRERYSQLLRSALLDTYRSRKHEFVIMLPDDVVPVPHFFERAVEEWSGIGDKEAGCLDLLADQRAGRVGWNRVRPKLVAWNNHRYWLSQKMDCCVIGTRDSMVGPILSVKDRARPNPRTSGAGIAMTNALMRAGRNIYQVVDTLVEHGDHPSVMHPEHRKANPLTT